jgi:hypothetical protein
LKPYFDYLHILYLFPTQRERKMGWKWSILILIKLWKEGNLRWQNITTITLVISWTSKIVFTSNGETVHFENILFNYYIIMNYKINMNDRPVVCLNCIVSFTYVTYKRHKVCVSKRWRKVRKYRSGDKKPLIKKKADKTMFQGKRQLIVHKTNDWSTQTPLKWSAPKG